MRVAVVEVRTRHPTVGLRVWSATAVGIKRGTCRKKATITSRPLRKVHEAHQLQFSDSVQEEEENNSVFCSKKNWACKRVNS